MVSDGGGNNLIWNLSLESAEFCMEQLSDLIVNMKKDRNFFISWSMESYLPSPPYVFIWLSNFNGNVCAL